MTENEGKREKMEKLKKGRGMIAFTGTAAVLAIAVNLVIAAVKHQKEKNAKKKGTHSFQLLNSLSPFTSKHSCSQCMNCCEMNSFLLKLLCGNLQILLVLRFVLTYLHLRLLNQLTKSLLSQMRFIIWLHPCHSIRYYRFASLCFTDFIILVYFLNFVFITCSLLSRK